MQVCLVQHALQMQSRLNLNERTIQHWNLAHQFISGQYDFYVFSVGGVKQGVRQTPLQAGSFCVAAVCRQKIGAKHQKQSKKENDKRYKHLDLHLLEEHTGQLEAARLEPLGKTWANSGGTEAPDDLSLRVDARSFVHEYLLHGYRLALHAGDF